MQTCAYFFFVKIKAIALQGTLLATNRTHRRWGAGCNEKCYLPLVFLPNCSFA